MFGLAKKDLVVLFLMPICASVLSLVFNPGYLIAAILFYFLPAFYIATRVPHLQFLRLIFLAAFLSFPFLVVVDYIGTISQIWIVPAALFPSLNILGIIPLEDIVWLVSGSLLILSLYHAMNHKQRIPVSRRKILAYLVIGMSALVVFDFVKIFFPDFLLWKGKYAYFMLGTIFFLIPGLILTALHKKLFQKELKIIPFFLFTTVIFELTATHLHYWIFASAYLLPPLHFGGFGPVPFEELFFVGVVGPIIAVPLYELMRDKR